MYIVKLRMEVTVISADKRLNVKSRSILDKRGFADDVYSVFSNFLFLLTREGALWIGVAWEVPR